MTSCRPLELVISQLYRLLWQIVLHYAFYVYFCFVGGKSFRQFGPRWSFHSHGCLHVVVFVFFFMCLIYVIKVSLISKNRHGRFITSIHVASFVLIVGLSKNADSVFLLMLLIITISLPFFLFKNEKCYPQWKDLIGLLLEIYGWCEMWLV